MELSKVAISKSDVDLTTLVSHLSISHFYSLVYVPRLKPGYEANISTFPDQVVYMERYMFFFQMST